MQRSRPLRLYKRLNSFTPLLVGVGRYRIPMAASAVRACF